MSRPSLHVGRYLHVSRVVREEHHFKQARRGSRGLRRAYKKLIKRRFDSIRVEHRRMRRRPRPQKRLRVPLMTNDRSLAPAQVLLTHKGQRTIEKRFEQVKTVQEIAPVFRKDEGRIEAMFTPYFLAMLVQALIERGLFRLP